MGTRLVSYQGARIDLAFPLQESRTTIGREGDNMIQLPHDKVSKHHAVILHNKSGWAIEDLDSTNGVIINGTRRARAELKNMDMVKIGPYEFYFETGVPSDDWVPSHIIDMSSEVRQRTIPDDKQQKQP